MDYICFFLESLKDGNSPVLRIDKKYTIPKKESGLNQTNRLFVLIKSRSLNTDESIIRYLGHLAVLKNSIDLIYFRNFLKGGEMSRLNKKFQIVKGINGRKKSAEVDDRRGKASRIK